MQLEQEQFVQNISEVSFRNISGAGNRIAIFSYTAEEAESVQLIWHVI